jgi:hypothetical protein
MAFRPHDRVEVDTSDPRAAARCGRCYCWINHHKLQWQMRWSGMNLVNTGLLVCPRCLDDPNPQERALVLPPDPIPIRNPRLSSPTAPGHMIVVQDPYHIEFEDDI